MNYPWYKILNENSSELQQGDLVPECPIVIPPKEIIEGSEVDIEVKMLDSIILSQSCDLTNDKLEIVLVCPYQPLTRFLKGLPEDRVASRRAVRKVIDNLRKGTLPGYHLLNKYGEDERLEDYQVVDFKNVYGINIDALKEKVKELNPRTRLLPPYREHLSQSFARYFMRVGLPQDIDMDENFVFTKMEI